MNNEFLKTHKGLDFEIRSVEDIQLYKDDILVNLVNHITRDNIENNKELSEINNDLKHYIALIDEELNQ